MSGDSTIERRAAEGLPMSGRRNEPPPQLTIARRLGRATIRRWTAARRPA